MKNIHANSIKDLMNTIGMESLGFNQDDLLSFAVDEKLEIILKNSENGINFIVPMPEFSMDNETLLRLLRYNHQLKFQTIIGYFSLDTDENIIVYQSLIPSTLCQDAHLLQQNILQQIQLCEFFMTKKLDMDISEIFPNNSGGQLFNSLLNFMVHYFCATIFKMPPCRNTVVKKSLYLGMPEDIIIIIV